MGINFCLPVSSREFRTIFPVNASLSARAFVAHHSMKHSSINAEKTLCHLGESSPGKSKSKRMVYYSSRIIHYRLLVERRSNNRYTYGIYNHFVQILQRKKLVLNPSLFQDWWNIGTRPAFSTAHCFN